MSKDILEKKLDILINLIETLPQRMMHAIEKSEQIRKEQRQKDIKDDIEFQLANMREINKMMYGVDSPKIKIEANDPNEQHIADQMAAVYNHTYMEGK